MRDFDTDYIQKVVDIMKNNEITEVSLEDETHTLFIKTDGFTPVVKCEEKEEIAEEVTIQKPEQEEEPTKKLYPVVSNMIGLFFSKPSPNEKPFVTVGDKVKEGQQLCIIETIKLMNKVTSEVSGTVKEICIEDGKPIEYGQTIMYIEQD